MTHTILQIDSSARRTGSVTRDLTNKIVAKLSDESTTLIKRDLLDGVELQSEDWLTANWSPEKTDDQTAILANSDTLINELVAADTIVIGAPIYNFSIPAGLKAWIDQIARAGLTFQYTENGPEGLLRDKKVIVAVASGGVPVGSDADFATPYIKFVLGFVGISDVSFVSADGLVSDEQAAIHKANAEIANL